MAIVGCSGTGSIVIEQLARLGVGAFVLADPDIIEAKNLNRIPNSTLEDADRRTPKVLVAKRMIDALGRGQSAALSRPSKSAPKELRRTNLDRYRELRRQKYIQGIEEDRPAVISVNAFFGALAVNEFLARVHVFRNVDNSAFSTVRGDLCEFALYREPEGGSKGHLLRELGFGDCDPLIGRPSLSVQP